jgi:hypothetical protein
MTQKFSSLITTTRDILLATIKDLYLLNVLLEKSAYCEDGHWAEAMNSGAEPAYTALRIPTPATSVFNNSARTFQRQRLKSISTGLAPHGWMAP